MIVSINQPAFFPWLGYFHRIAISDLHIVLDHVQFEKNSNVNRNKIRAREEAKWLTVPVITKGKFGDLAINKLEIANQEKWRRKITETIKQFYKKAPYFNDYFPFIEETLSREWEFLNDLMKHTNTYFLNKLAISTPLIYSSEINIEGTKGDFILNLCKKYGATEYISGPFGRDYLDKTQFSDNNLKLTFHDYDHPTYTQTQTGFISHLSIIDLLFNHGKNSKQILMT
jgi:hypothetical protein